MQSAVVVMGAILLARTPRMLKAPARAGIKRSARSEGTRRRPVVLALIMQGSLSAPGSAQASPSGEQNAHEACCTALKVTSPTRAGMHRRGPPAPAGPH